MKRLLLAILLLTGMGSTAWADAITLNVDASTLARRTRVVFNDSGSNLTSRSVVVWDNDDTEFGQNGYPYVTTTTTADDDWIAGVTIPDDCPDQTLCSIVVEGPAITRIANSTDVIVEDTLVSTSTVAGQAGDYAPAANTCALGTAMGDGASGAALRQADTGATTSLGNDNMPMWVNVHIECQ